MKVESRKATGENFLNSSSRISSRLCTPSEKSILPDLCVAVKDGSTMYQPVMGAPTTAQVLQLTKEVLIPERHIRR